MSNKTSEWVYFDERTNQWTRDLVSLDDLDRLRASGVIDDATPCVSKLMMRRGPKVTGIQYSQIARIRIEFTPDVEAFCEARKGHFVTVLCGPNNCGKTLLLKQIYANIGQGGYLVSCNRFSHIDVLNTRQNEETQYRNYYVNFVQSWHTSRQNTEDTEFKLEQAVTGLKNQKRDQLFGLCQSILGNTLSLRRVQPDNDFSPFYVDMDGENLRYGSTGTRLLLTLLGTLLNDQFRVLLIDEPEIGLSPRSQSAVANLIFDPDNRKEYWPHLDHVYLATHSHLFLDRHAISNNYVVRKAGDAVAVRQVQSIGELNQLQFNLLGNEFESVFLPSAIVLVEGDSDDVFLARAFALHIPNKRIAVVRAYGDGGMLSKLNVLRETFGDLSASPYRDRLFVLIDSQHSVRVSRVESMGVKSENIVVAFENGIEYQYPKALVCEVFRCSVHEVAKINLEADLIEHNGLQRSKKELAQLVAERLSPKHALGEAAQRLIEKVRAACG